MKYKLQTFLVLIAVVLIILVAVKSAHAPKTVTKSNPGDAQSQDQEIENFGKATAVDGVTVEQSMAQRPFAVVIENHPDARPQSGLSQADIVYEALAEGGITRFLAIFQSQDVKSIGPVRSARTYFNDWAQEWGAIYAHVGGNSDALALIKAGIPGVSDADQFFNDPYFTRISSRRPPHNTYTSIQKLKALAQAHEYNTQPSYGAYVFKNDAPAANPDASAININFSGPDFAVKWVYDKTSNLYARYLAGSAAIDAGDNKKIIAKNIIVQRVRNWPVQSDTPLAISMGTRESGSADVYQDGTVIHGTWKYVDGKTRFYDSNGKEISLNRGQIWIEIVPPDNSVTSK